jgi:hypothetical protein
MSLSLFNRSPWNLAPHGFYYQKSGPSQMLGSPAKYPTRLDLRCQLVLWPSQGSMEEGNSSKLTHIVLGRCQCFGAIGLRFSFQWHLPLWSHPQFLITWTSPGEAHNMAAGFIRESKWETERKMRAKPRETKLNLRSDILSPLLYAICIYSVQSILKVMEQQSVKCRRNLYLRQTQRDLSQKGACHGM